LNDNLHPHKITSECDLKIEISCSEGDKKDQVSGWGRQRKLGSKGPKMVSLTFGLKQRELEITFYQVLTKIANSKNNTKRNGTKRNETQETHNFLKRNETERKKFTRS
jgi:hypothetical protein